MVNDEHSSNSRSSRSLARAPEGQDLCGRTGEPELVQDRKTGYWVDTIGEEFSQIIPGQFEGSIGCRILQILVSSPDDAIWAHTQALAAH